MEELVFDRDKKAISSIRRSQRRTAKVSQVNNESLHSTSQQPGKSTAMSNRHSNQPRGSSSRRQQFRRSRSIKSEDALEIQGPLDIQGSVKSGSSISLAGDFIVKDKIDAYGAINMDGNVRCEGKIKAYGNILVNGYLVAGDKIKGCGKLKIVGSLEGTELEIYGNLSITGYLSCQRLIVYGSLTLVGRDSSYSVSEHEEIAGARLMREQEADWDW
ncbi:hypothetical protein LIA77_04818 [Sarocladium implicatum]|nr:hypothetical protein LIA77_04818 [Sarocladium implicatum]